MDVALATAQPLAVSAPAATTAATAAATASPAAPAPATATPARADTVQISQAAQRAGHYHHHHHGRVPGVEELAANDEAKLSDLAATFRQGFADRLKALGISAPATPAAAPAQATGDATAAPPAGSPTAATSTDATTAPTPDAATAPAATTTPATTTPATTTPATTTPAATTAAAPGATATPAPTDATTPATTPPPAPTATDTAAAPAGPTQTPTGTDAAAAPAPAATTPTATPAAPTTAAQVQSQLDATLKKLQTNADKAIETASAKVPTGNDHHSRYLQFLARRKIGYVTDLTRAEFKHAKEAADYELAHLPGSAKAAPDAKDGSGTAGSPATPPPAASTPATPPVASKPPAPAPADADGDHDGTKSGGAKTPAAPAPKESIAQQIRVLRQSAQYQLSRLAEDTAGRAARIEFTLDGQLNRLEGQLGVRGDQGGRTPQAGGSGRDFGPGAPRDFGPGFGAFRGGFGQGLPAGFDPRGRPGRAARGGIAVAK